MKNDKGLSVINDDCHTSIRSNIMSDHQFYKARDAILSGWSQDDQDYLIALLKRSATVRNIHVLMELLSDTEPEPPESITGDRSGIGSLGGCSMPSGGGSEVLCLLCCCCCCISYFGISFVAAKKFLRSMKNDYSAVKLSKYFLFVLTLVATYVVSQDFISEEVDKAIASISGSTLSALGTSSINNGFVIVAALSMVPLTLFALSGLSFTQRFSLRYHYNLEAESLLPKNDEGTVILPKHELVASTLLELLSKNESQLNRAAELFELASNQCQHRLEV